MADGTSAGTTVRMYFMTLLMLTTVMGALVPCTTLTTAFPNAKITQGQEMIPTLDEIDYALSAMNMALLVIKQRQTVAQSTLEDAVAMERWSQVSGHDGIRIGLLMAETAIRMEIGALTERRKSAAAYFAQT